MTEAALHDLVANIAQSVDNLYVEKEQKLLEYLYPDRSYSNLNEPDELAPDVDDSSFDGDEGFGDDLRDHIPYDLAKSLSRRESLIRIVLLGLEQSQTQSQGIDILKSVEVSQLYLPSATLSVLTS
jgi:hypothetical protein